MTIESATKLSLPKDHRRLDMVYLSTLSLKRKPIQLLQIFFQTFWDFGRSTERSYILLITSGKLHSWKCTLGRYFKMKIRLVVAIIKLTQYDIQNRSMYPNGLTKLNEIWNPRFLWWWYLMWMKSTIGGIGPNTFCVSSTDSGYFSMSLCNRLHLSITAFLP